MSQPIEISQLLEKKWIQDLTDDKLLEVIGKRIKVMNPKDGGFEYLFNFGDEGEEDFRTFDVLLRKNSLGFTYRHIEKDGKTFDMYQIELAFDRANSEHMTFRRLIKGIAEFLEDQYNTDLTSEVRMATAGKPILDNQKKVYPQIIARAKKNGVEPPPIEETPVVINISSPLYDGQFENDAGEIIYYSKFSTKANFAEPPKTDDKQPKKKTFGNKSATPIGQMLYIHPIKLVDPKVMEVNPKTGKEGPKVLDADKKIMKSDFHGTDVPKEYDAYVTRIKGNKVNVRVLAGGGISVSFGPYITQMNISRREKFERNEVDID